MNHYDGRNGKHERIDTRHIEFIAMMAVCGAYCTGQATIYELRMYHSELAYNSHKLFEQFGDHPLRAIYGELELMFADLSAGNHPELCSEFPYSEAEFRDKLRTIIGCNQQAGSSGYNVWASPNLFPSPQS